MTKLLTFEEIYEMKIEMEQAEKNKQTEFDGKSPSNAILTASNKGTLQRGGYFKFGEDGKSEIED
jgi:hypothetical protein